VTVTVYVPLDPGATVNDPDIVLPVGLLATVHSGLEMRPLGLEVIVQGPLSPAAKFEPVTRTLIPECPEVGVNATVGFIVKTAVAESTGDAPSGVVISVYPSTLTMYPLGTGGEPLGTVNEPVTKPEAMVQVDPDMGVTVEVETQKILHPLSCKLKLLPGDTTVTDVPMGPAVGESVIVGLFTVNVVETDTCCT
jgi:hypothetical protein